MILVLAGTEEAAGLARLLAASGRPAVASLAGVTQSPRDLGLPTRVGGFGGAEGFARYLTEAGVSAVVDATHPFAARIGPRTKALCDAAGVPYLRLLRPGWRPGPGDDWRWIDHPGQAAGLIPAGAVVLMAVGPKALADFAGLEGRRLLCRRIDPTEEPFPLTGGAWIVGRPSADPEAEADLMRAHGIGWVLAKDSGGDAGRGKLIAARQLGLPVILLRRPAPTDCPSVETPQAAMDWVRAL
jgi:precorrin-6A/cobalt-precorrin-6A reductase